MISQHQVAEREYLETYNRCLILNSLIFVQEALYNIAQAYHHVGLVSLVTAYYEKVLAIPQDKCPSPELFKADKDPASDQSPGIATSSKERLTICT